MPVIKGDTGILTPAAVWVALEDTVLRNRPDTNGQIP